MNERSEQSFAWVSLAWHEVSRLTLERGKRKLDMVDLAVYKRKGVTDHHRSLAVAILQFAECRLLWR